MRGPITLCIAVTIGKTIKIIIILVFLSCFNGHCQCLLFDASNKSDSLQWVSSNSFIEDCLSDLGEYYYYVRSSHAGLRCFPQRKEYVSKRTRYHCLTDFVNNCFIEEDEVIKCRFNSPGDIFEKYLPSGFFVYKDNEWAIYLRTFGSSGFMKCIYVFSIYDSGHYTLKGCLSGEPILTQGHKYVYFIETDTLKVFVGGPVLSAADHSLTRQSTGQLVFTVSGLDNKRPDIWH